MYFKMKQRQSIAYAMLGLLFACLMSALIVMTARPVSRIVVVDSSSEEIKPIMTSWVRGSRRFMGEVSNLLFIERVFFAWDFHLTALFGCSLFNEMTGSVSNDCPVFSPNHS